MKEIQQQLEATWEKDLKEECMNLIRQQPLDNVNMDQITTQLMNSGRDKIPQQVKDHAYNRIKTFLENEQAYQNFIKI